MGSLLTLNDKNSCINQKYIYRWNTGMFFLVLSSKQIVCKPSFAIKTWKKYILVY